MNSFEVVPRLLDPFIIPVFRFMLDLTGSSLTALLAGIFLLCLVCVMIGEVSMAFVYHLNRKHFSALNKDMVEHHNLSIDAIRRKDKTSYQACNHLANEAFGRNFFSHLALFASYLWPVPFALSWMSYRFGAVDFTLPVSIPAVGDTVGQTFVFLPMYVLVRILFGWVRPWLPFFGRLKQKMKENESGETLRSWGELVNNASCKEPDNPEAGKNHA